MPRWLAAHRPLLERIAHESPAAQRVVANLPTTTAQVAVAVAVELAVFLLATWLVARDPRPGVALYFYAALLGVYTAHSLTHLGQTLLLLSRRSALLSAAAGVLGMVPLLLTAHRVGRVLGATL